MLRIIAWGLYTVPCVDLQTACDSTTEKYWEVEELCLNCAVCPADCLAKIQTMCFLNVSTPESD